MSLPLLCGILFLFQGNRINRRPGAKAGGKEKTMTAHEIARRNFWNGDIYALKRYYAAKETEVAESNVVDMAAENDMTFDEIVALLNA